MNSVQKLLYVGKVIFQNTVTQSKWCSDWGGAGVLILKLQDKVDIGEYLNYHSIFQLHVFP